jgi:hypothetical protein
MLLPLSLVAFCGPADIVLSMLSCPTHLGFWRAMRCSQLQTLHLSDSSTAPCNPLPAANEYTMARKKSAVILQHLIMVLTVACSQYRTSFHNMCWAGAQRLPLMRNSTYSFAMCTWKERKETLWA